VIVPGAGHELLLLPALEFFGRSMRAARG